MTVRGPVRGTALLLALAAVLPLAACGADEQAPGSGGAGDERLLTVLAASSLTEVFTELGSDFEESNPGVRIRFAFDSSATLAQQAAQGAPADVLATADEQTMQQAVSADAVDGTATPFARNRLVLVAPADGRVAISTLADLERAASAGSDPGSGSGFGDYPDYVVCVPTAPCGDLAARALDAAGVTRPPVSLEVDVKAVLAKVVEDEADAGLVYASDAVAAGGAVRSTEIDGDASQATTYPAAVLADAAHPALARRWIGFLASGPGREALTSAGFDLP